MEIDAKLLKKLEELKKQLEGISGQKIDASPEQLIPFSFRVSLLSSEDGVIMSRSIIFPGKSCSQAGALPANLFDVSSRSSTGANGGIVCSAALARRTPVVAGPIRRPGKRIGSAKPAFRPYRRPALIE